MAKKKAKVKRDYHAEYLRRSGRGKHPQEIAKTGKTYPKRQGKGRVVKTGKGRKPVQVKVPKSRLEKKKEEWGLYSYTDPLEDEGGHFYKSMDSRDITKTQFKNYNSDALFAMHRWFEGWMEIYIKTLQPIPSQQNELQVEENTEKNYKRRVRRFEWNLIDIETENVVWFLQYEKGQIGDFDLPKGFPFSDFLLSIRSWREWK